MVRPTSIAASSLDRCFRRPRTYLLLVAAAVLLARPQSVDAQAGSATPDAAARSFFAALEARRWADAARMVHPAALARHREGQIRMLRSARRPPSTPPVTADVFLRHDPQMPRAVAEYQAQRANQGGRDIERIELESAGVASVEELERLSPEEVFTRFLAARDERRQMRRAAERQAADAVAAELLSRMAPRAERAVIGAVPVREGQGGDVAYVVYSLAHRLPAAPPTGPERVATIALRRDGQGWKLDPGETMAHELFGGGSFAVMLDPEGGMPDLAEHVSRVVVWPERGTPRLRVRMEGAGADPLKEPPRTLVLERLAPDGTVAARVDVPAEAWNTLGEAIGLWAMLVPIAEAPAP